MVRPRTPTSLRSQRAVFPATLCIINNNPRGQRTNRDTGTMLIVWFVTGSLPPSSSSFLVGLSMGQPSPTRSGSCQNIGHTELLYFWCSSASVCTGSTAAETEILVFCLGIKLIPHCCRVKIPKQIELDLSPIFTTYLAGCVTLDQNNVF